MAKKKVKEVNWKIVIAAIAALVVIEVVAMFLGYNGTLRTLIVGAILGLAGYVLPSPIKTK